MNTLYNQLNQNTMVTTKSSPNNNFINMIKATKNPKALLNNLMQTNPQIKQTMDMMNASSKSPKDLFYEMAKQKGVDPESILSQLR